MASNSEGETYLVITSGLLNLFESAPRELRFVARGFGERFIAISGADPEASLRWRANGREEIVRCDDGGRCELRLPAGDACEVRVWPQ